MLLSLLETCRKIKNSISGQRFDGFFDLEVLAALVPLCWSWVRTPDEADHKFPRENLWVFGVRYGKGYTLLGIASSDAPNVFANHL